MHASGNARSAPSRATEIPVATNQIAAPREGATPFTAAVKAYAPPVSHTHAHRLGAVRVCDRSPPSPPPQCARPASPKEYSFSQRSAGGPFHELAPCRVLFF